MESYQLSTPDAEPVFVLGRLAWVLKSIGPGEACEALDAFAERNCRNPILRTATHLYALKPAQARHSALVLAGLAQEGA